MQRVMDLAKELVSELQKYDPTQRIELLNQVRSMLHEISPLKNEPVDCVLWVESQKVQANHYNPNKVAPPEMRLLETSIIEDGYTQPIVVAKEKLPDREYTVTDGFHRNRVGKESSKVKARITVEGKEYLPVVIHADENTPLSQRMASTIRHNRARGSHDIDLMSNIVAELVEMGKSDSWIAKKLGMDVEEILRLKQITGLAALFKGHEFSQAWE